MGAFFGVASKRDCVFDIFFGVDYHSHLGTLTGGMLIHDKEKGFNRQIHSISNTPFRTKFEPDLPDFKGCSGLGCISDTDPQPLLVRSRLGVYGIVTVGIIKNADAPSMIPDQYIIAIYQPLFFGFYIKLKFVFGVCRGNHLCTCPFFNIESGILGDITTFFGYCFAFIKRFWLAGF